MSEIKIDLKKVSCFVDGKPVTRYLLTLPEYKQEIIIKEEYVDDLIKKIEVLKPLK